LYTERSALIYFEVLIIPFVSLVLPVCNRKFGCRFPLWLMWCVTAFCTMSVVIGDMFDVYNLFFPWDLICHGMFGFLFSWIFTFILLRANGEKLSHGVFLLIVFLATAGVAGLWEVWEFLADLLFATDGQSVAESVARGLPGTADTMEDIMIACVGVGVYLLGALIDKLNGGKLYRRLFEAEEESV